MARKLKIDNGGKVWAPYSPGITVRDHIWLAGQIGIEGGEDVVSQTQEALKKIIQIMEKTVKLDIPLIVDASMGKDWNEAH